MCIVMPFKNSSKSWSRSEGVEGGEKKRDMRHPRDGDARQKGSGAQKKSED